MLERRERERAVNSAETSEWERGELQLTRGSEPTPWLFFFLVVFKSFLKKVKSSASSLQISKRI